MLAKSAQHNTCAYAVSKAEEPAGPKQAILLKVTDPCDMVVSSGTATATITADASSQTQQIGQELIKLPPLPVSLTFDSTRGGFYKEADLKDLTGNLQKLSDDFVDKGWETFKEAIKDDLKKHGAELVAQGLLLLIPGAGEAKILDLALEFLRGGDVLNDLGDLVTVGKLGWALGKDFYQLATSPNPNFPIDVTVSYSNGAFQHSETQVISNPGSTEADFNFTFDSGVPCGPDIAGDWTGSLTQPNGPITDLFQLTMSFRVAGNQVTGSSHVVTGAYFVTTSLTGTLTGDRLEFSDTGITSQIAPPNALWCLKTGILTLSQSKSSSTLTGSWTAISPPGCLPGVINLTKVVATS